MKIAFSWNSERGGEGFRVSALHAAGGTWLWHHQSSISISQNFACSNPRVHKNKLSEGVHFAFLIYFSEDAASFFL